MFRPSSACRFSRVTALAQEWLSVNTQGGDQGIKTFVDVNTSAHDITLYSLSGEKAANTEIRLLGMTLALSYQTVWRHIPDRNVSTT
jgi:hypothetical protein